MLYYSFCAILILSNQNRKDVRYVFNLASILLGIAAIVFAVHSLQVRGCLICCTVCAGTTGLSLLCQLFALNYLAGIGDWAAIEDTIGARCLAAAVLLGVILVLTIAALIRSRKKGCETC